jgi:hypothetical protein
MNGFTLNKDLLISSQESWKIFANGLSSDKDKKFFNIMLEEYSNYISILENADKEYFPSEPLVIVLILSQYKKMVNWLMAKVLNLQLLTNYNKMTRNR